MGASGSKRRNAVVAGGLCLLIGGMIGLVSYSSTLYRLFCEATGFGGTTRRVEVVDTAASNGAMSNRLVTVRFNTDVAPGLPWRFEPVRRETTIHLGEETLVYFRAENLSDKPMVGHATFNVMPAKAGQYFNKIQCFCFTEERLGPHESVEMPVDFFVDPKLGTDPNTSEVETITLSYTFFASLAPGQAQDLNRLKPPGKENGR